MRSLVFVLLFALAWPTTASAHPLPTGRYDRTIAVRLGPEGITVTYTLDLTWFALNLDWARKLSPEEIAKLDKTQRGLAAACARPIGAEIAKQLHATANGEPLVFTVDNVEIDVLEHARYRYTLRAPWPAGGTQRAFAFVDDTFHGKDGILNLTLDEERAVEGFRLTITEEPPARYRNRPLTDADPEEARRAAAEVELPHEINAAAPVAQHEMSAVVINEGEHPSLLADLWRRGLPALFDSPYGVGVLLLAAFLFGAAHAFTPGHGKTLVAAYLVGERGTVGHALILALATTIAHTGSVIAIAVILWSAYGNDVPGRTQGVLQFLGGFLVAGVGLWLLLRRVMGRADHFHLFAGDHHHHDHGGGHHHHHHAPPVEGAKSKAGWVRLVLMGLGGGLIPCWDAVLLLLAAIALNRVAFAIPLLFAFSTGLGVVLVVLGVGVVYAYRAGATTFHESRWFRLLPIVSAVLLIGVGFWLCQEGLRAAVN